jgi:hypothetical protein
MSIIHNGVTITGLAEEVQMGTWERAVVYQGSFGVLGKSALDGGRTSRQLSVRVYVYGSFTATTLIAYIEAWNARVGAVGRFVDNGLQPRTLNNVELLAVQKEEGPLPTAPDGGWIAIVTFSFQQLAP